MMDHQELNRKLAEWAGFIWDEGAEYIGGGNNNQLLHGLWYSPSNDRVGSPDPPNFTQSLDACFKWLVPKLWVCQYVLDEGIFHVWVVSRPGKRGKAPLRCSALDKFNSSLAPCLAIEILVDKEGAVDANLLLKPSQ